MTDTWDGPHATERTRAEQELEEGADEISYRGATFFINDHERGWTYSIHGNEFDSLDAVFAHIDTLKAHQ